MKLRKLVACLGAASVMVGALASTADAMLVFPPAGQMHSGASTAGNWLVQIYNIGNPEYGKPATDYGIDVTAIDVAKVQIEITDKENFDGKIGGSVIMSSNGDNFTEEEWNKYNWPTHEWWGVYDETLGITSLDDSKVCKSAKIGDYKYEITCDLNDDEHFLAKAECVQIGLQEWGAADPMTKVTKLSCYDSTGKLLISFDEFGNPSVPATGLTLDKETATIYYDESVTLTATCTPIGATDKITWTSSDEKVATVEDGVVKGVAEGTATITASIDSTWATGGIGVLISDTFEVTVTGYGDEYSNGEYGTVKPEEAPAESELTEAVPETEISQEKDTHKMHVHKDKNGKKWRFYKLIKEEDLKGKKNAVMFIKSDKNENIIRIKSKNAFAAVNGVKAPEGYVYVSFTITDVPDDVSFTYSDIVFE